MARTRRRRSGEGLYHPSNPRLPRPIAAASLARSVYPLLRSEDWPNYGNARRRLAGMMASAAAPAVRRSPRSGPVHRAVSLYVSMPGVAQKALRRAQPPFLMAAKLPQWTPLMSTVLGDRSAPTRKPFREDYCRRRRDRREVLFALDVAGRVGRSPGRRGRYKRDETSERSC